jgi:hypothetical protein
LSLKLKIWPTSSPRSLIFNFLLLMTRLTARLCSVQMPPSSFVKIYFICCIVKNFNTLDASLLSCLDYSSSPPFVILFELFPRSWNFL